MYKVSIKGFNTVEEAESFCDWYEGSGEQEMGDWLEYRKEEGELDISSMCVKATKWVDEETLQMSVEIL